ncbi:MAG: hypothetical protein HRU27_06015 [Rhizobiaceae bacterium]|nr:hypothetical protein [Hyphomicrobiales bacterium]NRB30133.1 hypothetical protein [Rhizobiaceae bacterium]
MTSQSVAHPMPVVLSPLSPPWLEKARTKSQTDKAACFESRLAKCETYVMERNTIDPLFAIKMRLYAFYLVLLFGRKWLYLMRS